MPKAFLIVVLSLCPIVFFGQISSTKQEADDIFQEAIATANLEKRDSLLRAARLYASTMLLDSQYVHFTIQSIDDSLIRVQREDALIIVEDLIIRKGLVLDSAQKGWAHFTIGMLNSFELNPSESDLAKSRYHAKNAHNFATIPTHKYLALAFYYLNISSDSLFNIIENRHIMQEVN